MDRFDADVMDDLMYDAAEGAAGSAMDSYDEYDEAEGFDEYDEGDEGDAFIGRLLGGLGGLIGGGGSQFDEYDEFEAADEFEEGEEFDEYDEGDAFDEGDAMEDAVADALDAEDGDEFFRRLRRIASGALNVARRVGRGVGQVARVVGPIASMIPIPQAQLIGRLANVAGRLLADGADEFEAFDELVDGLDEDSIDAAAPVLAGMVVRRALPAVARAAAPVRRAVVRSVSRAVRQATRRQGAPAARAVARAVRATRRIVQRRRMPPRAAARVVRQAIAPGIGNRLDGWANTDLNPGAIVALSPAVPAATRQVLNNWGAGRYDPRINFDGLSTPIVLPPIYGLLGVAKETYTGEGAVSYWNAYVAVTQMHGQGNFSDARLGIAITQSPDLVTPRLAALRTYQLSLNTPPAPAGSYDAGAAARGKLVFSGAGRCTVCHQGATLSDINTGRLHAASETAMDPAYAARTTQKAYRTTPLRGLWQHAPYFHDGSAPTLSAVVEHYDRVRSLHLSAAQKHDLIEYLKSL